MRNIRFLSVIQSVLTVLLILQTGLIYAEAESLLDCDTLEEVIEAIEDGADVNENYGHGQTPLHEHSGDLAITKLLIQHGAKVNGQDEQGKTPLIDAISNPNSEETQNPIIKYLIGKGADVSLASKDKMSPLHYAAGYSDLEIVKLLVSKGAKINVQDDCGATPLYYAFVQEDIVEFLLSKGADPNIARTKNYGSDTPLHSAAEGNYIETAKLLIKAGAKLEAKQDYFETILYIGKYFHSVTPLHVAVLSGHLDMVKLLVESGADLKAKDSAKKTPVDYAEDEILKYLKKKK